MPRLISLSVLFAALTVATAVAAQAPVRPSHPHHRPIFAPQAGVDDLGPSDAGGYGAAYGPGWVGQGPLITRQSGGVNSLGNDLGTSGALGHVNGMPVTGH
jgi:hypothetical protein